MAEYEYHAGKDLVQVSGPPGKATRLKELPWIVWRFGKSYSRVVAAGDKEKLIGGEGETFPYCPF
jgi:hypothetical protein